MAHVGGISGDASSLSNTRRTAGIKCGSSMMGAGTGLIPVE